jgi:hypothetical protein
MALRKENFDYTDERARAMENNQENAHWDGVLVEINRKLYYRIKFVAEMKHITIREYVGEILDEMVPEINDIAQPGHPLTSEMVKRLREFREQVFRENNYQYMGDSVEELREIREARLKQLLGDDNADK